MLRLYGITSCDTVRRARKWLDGAGVDYEFHDMRRDGIDAATLTRWVQALGWTSLLNKHSTTWRKLGEADKADLDEAKAMRLMQAHPTLIKRPVLETGDDWLVGFSEASYRQSLKATEAAHSGTRQR